jgi:hypothetical protein
LGRYVGPRYTSNILYQLSVPQIGPGTFLHWSYFPLLSEDRDRLVERVETIMEKGTPGRQWHTDELFTELRKLRVPMKPKTDKYILDEALTASSKLTKIGRMIWVLNDFPQDFEATPDLISIVKATEEILIQAGHPLDWQTIRERLEDLRGLNHTLQLHANYIVARVDFGLWGLVDRDFGLDRDSYNVFMISAHEHLRAVGHSLTPSELREMCCGQIPSMKPLTDFAIRSLMQTDRRFKTTADTISLRDSQR